MSPKGPQPTRLHSTARLPKISVWTPPTTGVNRKPIQAEATIITKRDRQALGGAEQDAGAPSDSDGDGGSSVTP